MALYALGLFLCIPEEKELSTLGGKIATPKQKFAGPRLPGGNAGRAEATGTALCQK